MNYSKFYLKIPQLSLVTWLFDTIIKLSRIILSNLSHCVYVLFLHLHFACKQVVIKPYFFAVCLLLSSLITGGDLSLPGQRVVALALLYDIYKQENPFSSLFLHLLEGKPGLLPLAPQERLFIAHLHGFVPVNIKDVSIK